MVQAVPGICARRARRTHARGAAPARRWKNDPTTMRANSAEDVSGRAALGSLAYIYLYWREYLSWISRAKLHAELARMQRFEAASDCTTAPIACAGPTSCVAPRGRARSLRQWRRRPRSRRSPPAPPVWRRAPCPRTGWLARCRATALRYRPHCQRTCQSGGDERQVNKTRRSVNVSHSSGFQRPSCGPSTARATLRFARCSPRLARG